MNEFDLIARYFAPLAASKESLGLRDDAALLSAPIGMTLALTTDTLTQGVHFIGDETAGDIARKALRVNLSDLAAMGAAPHGYLLALMLPRGIEETWLAAFAAGLGADQESYGITLLGGDTTRSPDVLSLTLTAIGLVPEGSALTRSGAKAGDGIFVSGTLGDGAIGLMVAQGMLSVSDDFLRDRYRLPQPRIALGQKLRGVASACMDISDGLVQDLEHLCACSQAGAVVEYNAIPLSSAAQATLVHIENPRQIILAGGDDYELLFTAAPGCEEPIQAIAAATNTRVTRIGQMVAGKTVRVLDETGQEMAIKSKGYSHF